MPLTMCPFCNVEHESVQAMGTTVIGCPEVGVTDPPIQVNLPKLPPDVEIAYLRAAEALEDGAQLLDPGPMAIAWRNADWAWADQPDYDPTNFAEINRRAARLLRECVAAGRTLP